MNARELAEDYGDVICKLTPDGSPIPEGVDSGRIVACRRRYNYVAVELPPGTKYNHTGKDFDEKNWEWVVDQKEYLDKPVMRVKPSEIVVPKVEDDGKKADWEVVLSVVCPKIKRPRRTSLHTLATVCGRTDIMALAKEMKKSKKVVGYRCPDVSCLIFYRKDMATLPGMIDTRDSSVFSQVEAHVKEHPYPSVRGFKRFAGSTWTGGKYGVGKCIKNSSALPYPYEPDDYPYAREVIKALKDAGFEPGIKDVDGKIVAI